MLRACLPAPELHLHIHASRPLPHPAAPELLRCSQSRNAFLPVTRLKETSKSWLETFHQIDLTVANSLARGATSRMRLAAEVLPASRRSNLITPHVRMYCCTREFALPSLLAQIAGARKLSGCILARLSDSLVLARLIALLTSTSASNSAQVPHATDRRRLPTQLDCTTRRTSERDTRIRITIPVFSTRHAAECCTHQELSSLGS